MSGGRFEVTGHIWRVVEDAEYPAIQTFADERSAMEFWRRHHGFDDERWQEPVECELVTFIEEAK